MGGARCVLQRPARAVPACQVRVFLERRMRLKRVVRTVCEAIAPRPSADVPGIPLIGQLDGFQMVIHGLDGRLELSRDLLVLILPLVRGVRGADALYEQLCRKLLSGPAP